MKKWAIKGGRKPKSRQIQYFLTKRMPTVPSPQLPEMLAEAMRQVTREQIAEAAKQLTLDTVYLLRAEDGEEADADAG